MTARNQATQALRAGDPARAIPFLKEAVRVEPADADLWHDLGLACLECDDLAGAVAALRRSLMLRPGFADSQLRLGIALERGRAFVEALAAYRAAAALDPRLSDAQFRAGQLLESLGRTQEAAGAFRRAASMAGPKTLLGCVASAQAHWLHGDHCAAARGFRAALVQDPGNVMALQSLGQILAELGQFDAARRKLEEAVLRDPAQAGLYYDIARCRRLGPGDAALIAAMRAAQSKEGLEPTQRARLHLALGKAEEECGGLAEAMAHYAAAARLREGFAPFDLAAFDARIAGLMAAFPPGSLPVEAGLPAKPILIVGLPRSGTTLVEQILSAHPEVTGGGELSFWNECGVAWEADRGGDEAGFYRHAGAAYLTLLGRIGRGRVTDKMPLNFQWVGLALAALPRATVVHCRRNLSATALSIHRTHFNPRFAFPTGGEGLAGYCRGYARLMAHWRQVVAPARLIEVEYETLVREPEATIRRLVAGCGLGWDDACLHPELNMRAVNTPSKWQARQKIHTGSVDSWQRFVPWLGPLHL